jgi:hypothetical protein
MLSTRFCPICGASNKVGQTHCFACGYAFTTNVDAPATPDSPLLHGRYRLGTVLVVQAASARSIVPAMCKPGARSPSSGLACVG